MVNYSSVQLHFCLNQHSEYYLTVLTVFFPLFGSFYQCLPVRKYLNILPKKCEKNYCGLMKSSILKSLLALSNLAEFLQAESQTAKQTHFHFNITVVSQILSVAKTHLNKKVIHPLLSPPVLLQQTLQDVAVNLFYSN